MYKTGKILTGFLDIFLRYPICYPIFSAPKWPTLPNALPNEKSSFAHPQKLTALLNKNATIFRYIQSKKWIYLIIQGVSLAGTPGFGTLFRSSVWCRIRSVFTAVDWLCRRWYVHFSVIFTCACFKKHLAQKGYKFTMNLVDIERSTHSSIKSGSHWIMKPLS